MILAIYLIVVTYHILTGVLIYNGVIENNPTHNSDYRKFYEQKKANQKIGARKIILSPIWPLMVIVKLFKIVKNLWKKADLSNKNTPANTDW